uniref:Nuclear cap-binding protein subunit 3 n=1 Tax=Phallusia mammillata TaxID=59560 RepID=A0A6F9DML1_9ASCI|nr:uncharacterized protein C17orf85 homolog [Phallusia mammillata]
MAVEVEVVEVAAANSLLPNLTICVEKDDDEKIITDEPEEDKDGEQNKEDLLSEKSKAEVKPKLDMFPRKKLYENKRLAGLGLSFEEAKKKREERAKRFASPLVKDESKEENDTDNTKYLQKAEETLERIKTYNESLTEDDQNNMIRENALHLQGVDNMSTDEIFAYFGKMDPTHIEWINDTSCNVIWNDNKTPALTIQKVAEPKPIEEKVTNEAAEPTSADAPQTEISDELDLDMDVDNDLTEEQKPTEETEPVEKSPTADEPVNPLLNCKEPFVKGGHKQYLKVRFAAASDRKVLGAAKRSKYYVEYGNPHYGGAKGLFTGSYRKRYQMRNAMSELKGMKVGFWYTNDRERDKNDNKDDEDDEENEDDDMDDLKIKSKVEKTESERDDESLIKSSAKDLDGAIPVASSEEDDNEREFGTMVADQVSKKLQSARSMSRSTHGGLTVTTNNSNVRSRLGKRRYDNHERSSHDEDVLSKLPSDLRSRLGHKSSSSSHHRHKKSSSRRKSPEYESKKSRYSSPMNREQTRYSPPPWE